MTPQEEREQKVYEAISRATESLGLELIEVKIGGHKNDISIEVLADKTEGGISLEACSELNRSIVEMIDKEGILSEDGYSLEVSSPGLDRPLMTSKDYLRNLDSEVRILYIEKIAGKGEHTGIVKSVTEDTVTLVIGKTKKEQQEIVVPIGKILKGLLVI